jgi:hypothetical protein
MVFLADRAMLQKGAALNPYIDGSLPDGQWVGAPYLSMTQRVFKHDVDYDLDFYFYDPDSFDGSPEIGQVVRTPIIPSNPTQKEAEMLEAFSQTSAYQKHAQATARGLARLTAPQFSEPFLTAVKKAGADRFQSEVLPELIPVLRKLEVRIKSESFSSQN